MKHDKPYFDISEVTPIIPLEEASEVIVDILFAHLERAGKVNEFFDEINGCKKGTESTNMGSHAELPNLHTSIID